MSVRFTSEVPPIPDPDYAYINTEMNNRLPFDEAIRQNPDLVSDELKYLFKHLWEPDTDKSPKVPEHYARRYFEWSKAQSFIDASAVYEDDGRLNIDQTSQRIGIPYNYDMRSDIAQAEIVGLPGSGTEEEVVIHLRKDGDDHKVSFGHEIGHYFYRAIMKSGEAGYSRPEEEFCDYFGMAMALPKKYLETYDRIDEAAILDIMSRFNTNLSSTIEQLMEYGLLPRRVAVDTYNGKVKNPDYSDKVKRGIFCKHCSDVNGDWNCPDAYSESLLLDFTDRAWGGKMPSCCGEKLLKPEVMSTLTKYYLARETQLVLFRPGAEYEYDYELDENIKQ